jgi:GNAT superfamily N-acetyltransferase
VQPEAEAPPSFPTPGTTLTLLTRAHRRRRFASGDPRVDAWLIRKALGAMEKHTSATRVLAGADGTVEGYYTLATTALDVSLVPPAMFGGMVPTHAPPTLTLAWLGVDERFAGRGIGTKLFARALADAVEVHHLVRFVAMVIDALTAENLAFYARKGFLPVPGTTNKLYLPAATLLEVTARHAR